VCEEVKQEKRCSNRKMKLVSREWERSDPYILGVQGGEDGEVEVVDPSGLGAVEGHLPELHVLHHELVGALHVVERPAGMVLAEILDEDLPCPNRNRN
jgi:hypothetical protein